MRDECGRVMPAARKIFWRNDVQGAARHGRLKYLKVDEKTEQLFDLQTDARERTDLRRRQSQIFEIIRHEYREWEAQMLKPLAVQSAH